MWEKAEEFLLKDKYLRPLVKKYSHCTIKKSRMVEYFEDLVASIVEQQLSGKAAKAIFTRVRVLLKTKSPTPLSPLTPKDVLPITEEALRNCGISWSKTRYVKDLAEKVDRGELVLESLDKLDDEGVISELVKVKGIGRWTAEMFLMFTLARPDVFPLDDLGIQNGMEKLLGKNLDKLKMQEFSLRWKPHRTVASWYLWRLLDT